MGAVVGVVLIVGGGWFVLSYYSFEARFQRSKPALEAYAALAVSSDPNKSLPTLPKRLGDFEAVGVERLPHGFLFLCDYGHPLDETGLAYSTEPLPLVPYERDIFSHIEGNWYTLLRN